MGNFTNDQMLVILAVILLAALIYWKNRQPDKDGRLPDKAITLEKVEKIVLEDFTASYDNPKSKLIKEGDVQKQLSSFFEKRILHILEHKPIGGVTTKRIDFDLGCGAVGVELKMGKSVFKNAERNRLIGQISDYNKEGYGEDNLLLLIFCDETSMKKRVFHKEIIENLSDYKVKIHFLPIS